MAKEAVNWSVTATAVAIASRGVINFLTISAAHLIRTGRQRHVRLCQINALLTRDCEGAVFDQGC